MLYTYCDYIWTYPIVTKHSPPRSWEKRDLLELSLLRKSWCIDTSSSITGRCANDVSSKKGSVRSVTLIVDEWLLMVDEGWGQQVILKQIILKTSFWTGKLLPSKCWWLILSWLIALGYIALTNTTNLCFPAEAIKELKTWRIRSYFCSPTIILRPVQEPFWTGYWVETVDISSSSTSESDVGPE